MNVIVQPNGAAALDDRPVDVAARECFHDTRGWIVLSLIDEGDRVGAALFLPNLARQEPAPVNTVARAMVAGLVSAHVEFRGVVVLTYLDAVRAAELIGQHAS